MTISMDKNTVQDAFRDGVLAALDKIARETFFNVPAASHNDVGATDADLPQLFKAIDEQVERLCERFDIVLVEPRN